MTKFLDEMEPVIVSRCGGYPIYESLIPENRKKAREKVKDPNYISSKYKLKEIFSKFGIIVNPEAMTYINVRNI